MRKCHSIVPRIVDVIVTRVRKKTELQSDEYDFDDLDYELVRKSERDTEITRDSWLIQFSKNQIMRRYRKCVESKYKWF